MSSLASSRWSSRAVAVGLVLLGSLLILPNLGNRYLWEDEAETALLARNVLRFGLPVAFDGVHVISQECGTDYDGQYLWRQTGWLPIYLAAASFRAFGEGTLAARLPFALIGLLAPVSLYALARRCWARRAAALVAGLSLLLSVPFLLHVRQARYYALVIVATIWILHAALAVVGGRRLALVGLVVALTVLLQSSTFVAAAVVAGLAAGLVVVRVGRAAAARLAAAAVAALAVNLPLLVSADLGDRVGFMLGIPSPATYAFRASQLIFMSELHALPALLLLAGLLVAQRVSGTSPPIAPPERRTVVFLATFALVYLLVIALRPLLFFRYLLPLLPVFALLQAQLLLWTWARHRLVAALVALLALGLDRSQLLGGSVTVPLGEYAWEITHDVDGPIKGIVRYLRAEARPGDRVLITYGDLPLRFYLPPLDVRGGQACQDLSAWPEPDWVIDRYFYRFRSSGPRSREDSQWTRRYLQSLPAHRYQRVVLTAPDTKWENIPEPDFHTFRPGPERPRVVVLRKIRSTAAEP